MGDVGLGWIFTALIAAPILVQIALALGAPWGALTMGGRYPGRLPKGMRLAAIFQAMVLCAMACVVLDHAGAIDLIIPRAFFWVVCGVISVSVVLHVITPSRVERLTWLPFLLGAGLCLILLIW